jgi:hypothetical protein
MLSEQERQIILDAKSKGLSKEQALAQLASFRTPVQFAPQSQSRFSSGLKNFLGDIIKDPIENLLVRPAVRATQAGIAGFGAITGNEKAMDFGSKDVDVRLPLFGNFKIEGQKTGTAGVKQILGDTAKTASYLYAPGKIAGTAGSAFKQGAIQGAKAGAISGGLYGAGEGLQENKSLSNIGLDALSGAALGAGAGGILGGAIAGVSGALANKTGRELIEAAVNIRKQPRFNSILNRITPDTTNLSGLRREAIKQGFSESQTGFLSTLKDADLPVYKKMYDAAVKFGEDERFNTRAADILGESITDRVNQVQAIKSEAGKAIDQAAKGLKGKAVDSTPLKQNILKELDNAGIRIAEDGTLDFSESIFKNLKPLQKQLTEVINSVPDGSDAYQLHIFKKTLDEMIDFGTRGEGLKGNAQRLLKSFRRYTDELLDGAFDEYDQANQLFSYAQELLDQAKLVVGKNIDFSKPQGSQAFGQAMRSAFSNNKSRWKVLEFLRILQEVADELNLSGKEMDIYDQALFVNILEDVFGAQSTTALTNEVQKAFKTGTRIIEGIKKPLGGVADLIGAGLEKLQNISPEQKRKVLEQFITR